MQFPDGWYVCTDDKERRQVYGPFKDEEKAWSVAAKNGYSYLIFPDTMARDKEACAF